MNIPPIVSQETRHFFAVIAKGEENTREIGFYSDLVDKSNLQQGCHIPSKHTDQSEPDHLHVISQCQNGGISIRSKSERLFPRS